MKSLLKELNILSHIKLPAWIVLVAGILFYAIGFYQAYTTNLTYKEKKVLVFPTPTIIVPTPTTRSADPTPTGPVPSWLSKSPHGTEFLQKLDTKVISFPFTLTSDMVNKLHDTNLVFSIPKNWTINEVNIRYGGGLVGTNQPSYKNKIYKCSDYVITNSQKTLSLKVKRLCETSEIATYGYKLPSPDSLAVSPPWLTEFPYDAEVVYINRIDPDEPIPPYRYQYTLRKSTGKDTYKYISAEVKNKEYVANGIGEISEFLRIEHMNLSNGYWRPHTTFMPFIYVTAELTYHAKDPYDQLDVAAADQIIASLTLL